jgi:hypothetical protein
MIEVAKKRDVTPKNILPDCFITEVPPAPLSRRIAV